MRNRLTHLAVASVVMMSSAVTANAVEFASTVIDANGPPKIWGKGAGDLNGDGKSDLVVGSVAGGLYWYENPGWQRRTISSTARIEEDMDVVDLDRDGRRDIVAVTPGGLTWFRNATDGWSQRVLVTAANLHDVVVTELDGDGRLDLAARNQGSSGDVLYLWRQVSLTSWAAEVIRLPAGGEGLARADLDRDGRFDLIIGEFWFRNEGRPGDLAFRRLMYGDAAPKDSYLTTADINGDGRTDIVASPSEPAGQYHDLFWFEAPANPVTGSWIPRLIERGIERATHFVGVQDFDLDGTLDVVTALTEKALNPRIKLYLNKGGRGSFGPPQIIANTSSHSMKLVRVGSDAGISLFGADYDDPGTTPVRLFRWLPD